MSSRPLAQRRHDEAHDVQAEVEVLAELPLLTSCSRFRLVAVTRRTSSSIVFEPPTRSIALVSRKRRSFTWIEPEISPISSRKRVPAVGRLEAPDPPLGRAR